MRHASKILLTLCILLCASCGGAGSVDTGAEVLLTDVLTLELAFGADNLPEEYLLTFPEISFVGAVVYIGVDNNGNIFVADDSKIKIYDSNGLPLKMFGGLGYGPGEFGRDRFTSFNISANGYLTQKDGNRYNIFRPDQTLVESKNYLTNAQLKDFASKYGSGSFLLSPIVAFDESRRMYGMSLFRIDQNIMKRLILYERSNTEVSLIYQIEEPRLSRVTQDMNYYRWALLPDETLVVSSSIEDVVINEREAHYSINLISLETGEVSAIRRSFKPEIFPEDVKEKTIERFKRSADIDTGNPRMNDMAKGNYEHILEVFAGIEFKTPIKMFRVDRHYLFVFTTRKNESGDILTDVFDTNKKQYIISVYLPFIPKVIKNGYAYRVAENVDGFEIIEKYKIDPAVYSK